MRDIRKASGKLERYNRNKLISSLLASGLDLRSANKVTEEVERIEGIETTKDLYDTVREILLRKYPIAATRYSLKDAIMRLGPTGFPFEEYTAQIFRSLGHQVKTHQFIRGKCVVHEIDLLIDSKTIGECKYHNKRGIYTGLKEAMYTYMRFLDIKPLKELKDIILITNTKFSNKAVEFSSCYGLSLLGWKYPPGKGLEVMIERSGTYPITVLSGILPDNEIKRLVSSRVVTITQLAERGDIGKPVAHIVRALLGLS